MDESRPAAERMPDDKEGAERQGGAISIARPQYEHLRETPSPRFLDAEEDTAAPSSKL